MNAVDVDLEAVACHAVEIAGERGADDAEAWVEDSRTREIRVYDGAVESLTDAGGRGLGLRVFISGREGHAYGTDLTPDGMARLAEAAVRATAVTDPDEHAGLPDECGAVDVPGLYSDRLAGWTIDRKVDLALEVERAARARPGVTQVEDTVYADSDGQAAIANSRGFSAEYESTSAWAYASAFAGEGAELMTGLGLGLGRGPDDLDPAAVGGEAADRAIALTGARRPDSRHCPVVLDAFVAASFLGFIGQMLSAEAVQRGRSLFADREGDEIAAPDLRLVDDGTDPGGPASAPFDGEGARARATPLVEGGRLSSFLFDAVTARRAGRETTGNAVRGSYRAYPSVGASNLTIDPGDLGLEDLCRRAGDGLYVADVAGLHSGVNPVTGRFSVGATGRLIAGGELGSPVREATIAGDLESMLRAVAGIGRDARWVPFGGSVRACPLLIGELSVSGS